MGHIPNVEGDILDDKISIISLVYARAFFHKILATLVTRWTLPFDFVIITRFIFMHKHNIKK